MLVRDAEQAMAVVNCLAPEHLELLVRDADELRPEVRNAGAVFVGAPDRARRLRRRREPRAADRRRGPVLQRAAGRRLPQAHPRRPRHAGGARAPSGRPRSRWRGPRASSPHAASVERRIAPMTASEPARRPAGAGGLPLAPARRLGAAQHEREPVPAAAGVRRRVAAGRSRPRRCTATRTAAPRACAPRSARRSANRPTASSLPTGRTRCCRRCCSPTAARAGAALVFEPTYALHSHIARITGHRGHRGAAPRRLRHRRRPRASA